MSKINFTLISPLLDTEFCFSVNKTVKWSQLKSTRNLLNTFNIRTYLVN